MRIAAIIQARMMSTRLPKKILLEAVGKTLLELLLERLKHSQYIKDVIIATTTNPQDDILAEFCTKHRIPFFRGSENDVLDRYYQTAKKFGVDIVVRITSDCPLIDPKITDQVIKTFLDGTYDYVSNIAPPTYPDGLDTYVFTFKALERAWKEAKDTYEREHVTPYFWKHPDIFKVGNVENTEDLSRSHRWTIDYPEDYQFLKRVFEELYQPENVFHMEDVLALVKRKPEIYALNANRLQNNSFK
jgi:spore coat polysaccharide biosynthesis protein SpsF